MVDYINKNSKLFYDNSLPSRWAERLGNWRGGGRARYEHSET